MKLYKKLKKELDNTDNELEKYVIDYWVNDTEKTDESIKSWYKDLTTHGCVSGMIGDLIYYTDTHKFYDDYYEEIEELRIEIEDSMGESINIKDNDLKNTMAWFGFEETVRNIANRLEIDY